MPPSERSSFDAPGMSPGDQQRQAKTTVAGRVKDWFGQFSGRCFCDACVAKATASDLSNVSNTTNRMGGQWGYSRYRGRCSICNSVRTVTIVNDNVPM